MERLRGLRWTIVAPAGLVTIALLVILGLDLTKGGAATPNKPLGEIGTPVRGVYVAPTATCGVTVRATARPVHIDRLPGLL